MTVCQICGDVGYSKLLIPCLQCQDIAAHRYCVLNPSILEEHIKWYCEFCDPVTAKPPIPSRKGQGLSTTVQQAASGKTAETKLANKNPNNGLKGTSKETADIFTLEQKNTDSKLFSPQSEKPSNGQKGTAKETTDIYISDQKKTNNKLFPPQSEKPNDAKKETAKETTDIYISDQKNTDNKLLPPHSEKPADGKKETIKETTDICISDQKNTDKKLFPPQSEKPNNGLKETAKEKNTGNSAKRNQRKRSDNVKEAKKINQCNNVNGVKVCPEAVQAKEQNIKNASLSDTNGQQQVSLGNIVCALQAVVGNDVITGDTKLVEQKKLKSCLVPKKGDGPTSLDKSSCNVFSKQVEELHIGESQPDSELVDNADNRGPEVEERIIDFVKRKQLKGLVGVKKAKKITEGCSEAVPVKKQNVKNVSVSDTNGHRRLNRGKNVGSPLSKVKDSVKTESKCKAGDSIQGGTKLVTQQKLTNLAPKKGGGGTSLNKSSCEDSSKQVEELHLNKSQSNAEVADHADEKKSECEKVTTESVVERQAPRKRRRVIIEVEYSDEEPVFDVNQLLASVSQDHLSKSTSAALSKLSDDSLHQPSSVESIPHRPSSTKVDDRGHTRESSMVVDNCIPGQAVDLVHAPAQPLTDVAWRGRCSITGSEYPMSLVLGAHLSNKAHENVQAAVCELPESLKFCLLPKRYAWPKTFERSPPTADVIGLYFFLIDERSVIRSERMYEFLIDEMSEHDLVLKAFVNYVELLVFCSQELPPDERSLQRKYYLWGVFKPRTNHTIPNNHSDIYISKRDPTYQQEDLPTPSITDPAYYSTRSFSNPRFSHEAVEEPVELTWPINREKQGDGIDNFSSKRISNTRIRQEAVGESVEFGRPITKPRYQTHEKQEGLDVSDGDARIFQKPRYQTQEGRDVTDGARIFQKPRYQTRDKPEGRDVNDGDARIFQKPRYQKHDEQEGRDVSDGDDEMFQKPQEHEHQNRSRSLNHGDRNHHHRRNDNRWNRESKKRKYCDWKSSRRSQKPYYRSRSDYR